MHFCDLKSDIVVNLQILKDRDVIDRRDYKLKCSSSTPVIHTQEKQLLGMNQVLSPLPVISSLSPDCDIFFYL